ncbi:hypothetical protein DPM19_19600 [Actinomadura craniellae]|uniref:Rpn family recombination-promoting nuclease/putative transposase n=1 Tax=Actinomadura craniellae TaxID=2231787 RepID=A0A365H2G4_9ACTN|nr:hypothetical protein [Actinomadura craniellae]RAY13294.1 hypothetical protein DPM19_19600 [Actinomadura craniellae]
MPSLEHEMPLELFRNRPELAPELLRTVCGVAVPDSAKVSLSSETLNDVKPKELRCDTTVLVGDPTNPELGIIVEVQLKPSTEKRFSWPAYLAVLRARCRCPVTLLVLCPTAATAAACAEPIDLGPPGGPDWVLRPQVLGPDRLPVVTDAEQARRLPELSVLSAVAHTDHPDYLQVLDAYLAALSVPDEDTAFQYHQYVRSQLSGAARDSLEELMTTTTHDYEGAFTGKYHSAGKAEGEAEMILVFLEARGLDVSDEARERITSCTDLDQLKAWGRRAAVVESAEGLFD